MIRNPTKKGASLPPNDNSPPTKSAKMRVMQSLLTPDVNYNRAGARTFALFCILFCFCLFLLLPAILSFLNLYVNNMVLERTKEIEKTTDEMARNIKKHTVVTTGSAEDSNTSEGGDGAVNSHETRGVTVIEAIGFGGGDEIASFKRTTGYSLLEDSACRNINTSFYFAFTPNDRAGMEQVFEGMYNPSSSRYRVYYTGQDDPRFVSEVKEMCRPKFDGDMSRRFTSWVEGSGCSIQRAVCNMVEILCQGLTDSSKLTGKRVMCVKGQGDEPSVLIEKDFVPTMPKDLLERLMPYYHSLSPRSTANARFGPQFEGGVDCGGTEMREPNGTLSSLNELYEAEVLGGLAFSDQGDNSVAFVVANVEMGVLASDLNRFAELYTGMGSKKKPRYQWDDLRTSTYTSSQPKGHSLFDTTVAEMLLSMNPWIPRLGSIVHSESDIGLLMDVITSDYDVVCFPFASRGLLKLDDTALLVGSLFGKTFVAATGDWTESCVSGSNPFIEPSMPSASPYVISVAPTRVQNTEEKRLSEVPSCSSYMTAGGGFSFRDPAPGYQLEEVSRYASWYFEDPSTRQGTDVMPEYFSPSPELHAAGFVCQPTCEGVICEDDASCLIRRGYPDVSFSGEGVDVYFSGKRHTVSGSHVAAARFASMITALNGKRTMAGKKKLGFLNKDIYRAQREALSNGSPAPFSDISDGLGSKKDNPCGSFRAFLGWDPVSGLGSPRFIALEQSLVKNTP